MATSSNVLRCRVSEWRAEVGFDAGSRLLELQRVERGRGRERGGSSEVGTAEWCARLAGGGFLFKPLTFQAPAGWTILFQEPGPGVDYSFSPF